MKMQTKIYLVISSLLLLSPLIFSCTDVYDQYMTIMDNSGLVDYLGPDRRLINATLITDPNLRTAIATQLGIPESKLAAHFVGELKNLDVQINTTGDITSLAGIEQFSLLTNLSIYDCSVTSLAPAYGLSKLTGLSVQRTKMNYSDLAQITTKRFPALDSLWLGDNTSIDLDSHVSDIIALFASLPNLHHFGLDSVGLTDAQFSEMYDKVLVDRFTNYGSLGLYGNKLTNASLSLIAKLANIGYLNISSNPITDLSALSSLSNLNGLSLDSTKITDFSPLLVMYAAGSFHNNGNVSLTNSSLNLRTGTANRTVIDTLVSKGVTVNYEAGNFASNTLINASLITDANLRAFIAAKIGVPESALGSHYADELTDLNPNYTAGSAISSLAGLSQFISLNNVGIWGQPVTTLSPLYGMPSINSLSLSGTSLNYSALTGITPANFPSLSNLWLGDSVDADLEFHIPEIFSIFTNFPKLGGAGIDNVPMTDAQFSSMYSSVFAGKPTFFWGLSVANTQLTNASMTQIAKLTGLGYLNISGTQISDLTSISSFSNLNNLSLSSTKVTDLSLLLSIYNAGSFHNSGGNNIDVNNNNLDLRTGTANRTIIDTLISNGISVTYTSGNTVN